MAALRIRCYCVVSWVVGAFVLPTLDIHIMPGTRFTQVPVLPELSCAAAAPGWGELLAQLRSDARPRELRGALCAGGRGGGPAEPRGAGTGCALGAVAALLARARHGLGSAEAGRRGAAEAELLEAAEILGEDQGDKKDDSAAELLGASPWPGSALDALINLNQTAFVSYDEHARERPVPPPGVPARSLHWRPAGPPSPGWRGWQGRRGVVAAVVGSHGAMALEPVDMMRRYLHSVELQVSFHGLGAHWCQSLGVCGPGPDALGQLLREVASAPPGSVGWDAARERVQAAHAGDASLQQMEFLVCTGPLAVCLLLWQVARSRGRRVPLLGYLSGALLRGCPPDGLGHFRDALGEAFGSGGEAAVLAASSLLLSEQVLHQTGLQAPYVRPHGLYAAMAHVPLRASEVLVWQAAHEARWATTCTLQRLVDALPAPGVSFRFAGEQEEMPYQEMPLHRGVALLPRSQTPMVFYELYSAAVPLLLPSAEWMHRLLHGRAAEAPLELVPLGGSREGEEAAEAADPSAALRATSAGRLQAERSLQQGLRSQGLEEARGHLQAALRAVQDMQQTLAAAESLSRLPAGAAPRAQGGADRPARSGTHGAARHPYSPLLVPVVGEEDVGGAEGGAGEGRAGPWLRRGGQLDAVRYWHQFSDVARFPGLRHFASLPELLCAARALDMHAMSKQMRRYNQGTLVDSAAFWAHAAALLGPGG
ncbi:unnamed protein product [Prorocentrum cordatum]|uniref:Uncharacterized protein n=1 Tax=Prorocentrum cordatum TaxID=2364126 RepID=A0ABN9WF06_9DINO|nr:unnamed protein product [Polarella glacialis]